MERIDWPSANEAAGRALFLLNSVSVALLRVTLVDAASAAVEGEDSHACDAFSMIAGRFGGMRITFMASHPSLCVPRRM